MPVVSERNQLDPAPFRDWVERRLSQAGAGGKDAAGEFANEVALRRLANELGIGDRRLHRWRKENKTLNRLDVAEALERAGSALWEVYGVDAEDVALEDDAYCHRCKETVTPIDGLCPWCDADVGEARARRWCPREDRLVHPANDGTCWRCGTDTESIPWADCACGCGTPIPLFDPQGRKHKFAIGHAPKSEGKHYTVPAEPFAKHLEEELQRMDLVGALARAHGIPREEVVRVLKRQVDELPTKLVRRALWTAARGGTGKGLPLRPGAPTLGDLYPDFIKSRTCPGCGDGKAPHAELCKKCRRKADRRAGKKPPGSTCRIRTELIEEAWAIYAAGGSALTSARAIIDRTPSRSETALAASLKREWKRQGRVDPGLAEAA